MTTTLTNKRPRARAGARAKEDVSAKSMEEADLALLDKHSLDGVAAAKPPSAGATKRVKRSASVSSSSSSSDDSDSSSDEEGGGPSAPPKVEPAKAVAAAVRLPENPRPETFEANRSKTVSVEKTARMLKKKTPENNGVVFAPGQTGASGLIVLDGDKSRPVDTLPNEVNTEIVEEIRRLGAIFDPPVKKDAADDDFTTSLKAFERAYKVKS